MVEESQHTKTAPAKFSIIFPKQPDNFFWKG